MMTNSNKVLIGLVAVVAFAIGVVVNSARVQKVVDAQMLLEAKLVQGDGVSTVQDQLGKLTLINFWASWCTPCRKEMPIFEVMFRQANQSGFQVIGVAIDSPDKTQAMLDSMDISYPILYAEKTGMELMETVGNPQGFLPYTLLLDSSGVVVEQVLGPIDEQQIAEWLNSYLPNSASTVKQS